MNEERRKTKKPLVFAVCILAVALIATGGFAVWSFLDRQSYMIRLENVYEKSFYNLVSDMNDVEVKLSKLSVAQSPSYQRELLVDVWRQSDVAESELAQLNSRDVLIEKTATYVNQLGDYCKYLAEKTETRALDRDEKAALASLHATCKTVGRELAAVRDKLGSEYTFLQNYSGSGNNLWDVTFSELEDTSIDYPALIYDGPFSDGMQNKTVKGIGGEKIGEEEGKTKIAKLFGVEKSEVNYIGTWQSKLQTLTYELNGATVQLATDGTLLSYNAPTEMDQAEYGDEACRTAAENFLQKAGFSDMQAVWQSNYGNVAYINFAYTEGGVIIYPDMIKVKVSGSSGKVVGAEAMPYCYNHVSRHLATPTLSENSALSLVDPSLEVESVRLALIPKNSSEILTYEVFGTVNGEKYFVYIDAETGEDVNVLAVIDGERGLLL